jgi:hypothetical protein
MTISSTTRRAGPYIGNGVTTLFPFNFKVFKDADLLVVRADPGGAESALVLGADYTVTLNLTPGGDIFGGTVAMTAPLADGWRLVITSAVPQLQPMVITNQGKFFPDVLNNSADRAVILIQQIREVLSRALTVPITSDMTPDEFKQFLLDSAAHAGHQLPEPGAHGASRRGRDQPGLGGRHVAAGQRGQGGGFLVQELRHAHAETVLRPRLRFRRQRHRRLMCTYRRTRFVVSPHGNLIDHAQGRTLHRQRCHDTVPVQLQGLQGC